MADQQQVNTVAPEVSQPYSIPAGMTAEAAMVRTKELIHDPDFSARLSKGGQDSREARELDALQRHALGAQPQTAVDQPQTAAEARAAALDEVPGAPDQYENLEWTRG